MVGPSNFSVKQSPNPWNYEFEILNLDFRHDKKLTHMVWYQESHKKVTFRSSNQGAKGYFFLGQLIGLLVFLACGCTLVSRGIVIGYTTAYQISQLLRENFIFLLNKPKGLKVTNSDQMAAKYDFERLMGGMSMMA